MQKTCAITGHRPDHFPFGYNENDPEYKEFKLALYEELRMLAHQGYETFLTGMAQGTDLWAAENLLLLRKQNPRLRLVCVLPCEHQDRYWPREQQCRYAAIIQQADQVIQISQRYSKYCMFKRNKYLVDNVSLVLAVYDGSPLGGTAQTVRYAQKRARELRLLNPSQYPSARFTVDHQASSASI